MPRPGRYLLSIAVLLAATGAASAQSPLDFSGATETPEELIALYDAADGQCRLSTSDDVEIQVACVSRSIYGAALNAQDWCYGRESEANADMEWHACAADSLRFPPVSVTYP